MGVGQKGLLTGTRVCWGTGHDNFGSCGASLISFPTLFGVTQEQEWMGGGSGRREGDSYPDLTTPWSLKGSGGAVVVLLGVSPTRTSGVRPTQT